MTRVSPANQHCRGADEVAFGLRAKAKPLVQVNGCRPQAAKKFYLAVPPISLSALAPLIHVNDSNSQQGSDDRVAISRLLEPTAVLSPERGINPDLREICRLHGRMIETPRGDEMRLDTECTAVMVLSGCVKLSGGVAADCEQIAGFYFPGNLLFPASGRHGIALAALENSTACELPPLALLAQRGLAAEELACLLRQALLALEHCRIANFALACKTAPQRVASFLVEMADRIGQEQRGDCVIALPMSRRDIAGSLGLTIETVSRQISDLQRQGLLTTCGRSDVVLHRLSDLRLRTGDAEDAA